MYRTGEEAVVTEIRDRGAAGDVTGMLAVLERYWLAVDGPATARHDLWAEEVWRALEVGGQLPAALERGLSLVRDGQRIRPASFVHIVQHVDRVRAGGRIAAADSGPRDLSPAAAQRLLALADLAFDRDWPDDRYIGAVFVKLVEGRCKRVLWPHVMSRVSELAARTSTWQLIGVLAACHPSPVEPVAWLDQLDQHPEAEPWLRSLRSVIDRALPTASGEVVGELDVMMRDLAAGRWADFVRVYDGVDMAGLRGVGGQGVVAYLNRFKHRFPVERNGRNHGFNDQAARFDQAMGVMVVPLTLLNAFRELLALERKRGPRVRALGSVVRRTAHGNPGLAWAREAWEQIIREEGNFGDRFHYALFG